MEQYGRQLNEYYRTYPKCKNTSDNPSVIKSKCANIQLQQTVDLDHILLTVTTQREAKLSNIQRAVEMEDKQEFERTKREYVEWNNQIQEYQRVMAEYQDKMDKLLVEQNELKTDIAKTFYDRQRVFKETVNISQKAKEILMRVYKNEGLIKQARASALAKQLKLKEKETMAWIKWFDLSVQYIRQTNQLNAISKRIAQLAESIKTNMEQYEVQSRKVLGASTSSAKPSKPTKPVMRKIRRKKS